MDVNIVCVLTAEVLEETNFKMWMESYTSFNGSLDLESEVKKKYLGQNIINIPILFLLFLVCPPTYTAGIAIPALNQ